jgi:hypothetical protein
LALLAFLIKFQLDLWFQALQIANDSEKIAMAPHHLLVMAAALLRIPGFYVLAHQHINLEHSSFRLTLK